MNHRPLCSHSVPPQSVRLFSRLSAGITMLLLNSMLQPQLYAQSNKPTVKVVEHVWGFDGRVQPGQFNPLSILLDNQTDESVEVTATLHRIQGMMNRSGGDYAQPLFLAPAARRWIQFYPYVANSYQTEWRLSINDGDRFKNEELEKFQQPRPSYKLDTDNEEQLPQVVILDRPGGVTSRPTSLKHMPENIFPPFATATFGLHTVFLDHVPDWELPRQEAFLSWLKQGGRLHLLKNGRNEVPRFSGELADLNQPMQRFTVGSGIVIRHDIQREAVTEQLVKRSVVLDVLKGPLDELEKELQNAANQGLNMGNYAETEASSIDESIFRSMRELTFPDHNWAIIFLLALCYIGLIFPGCFILSKKKHLHFLTTYGAIVGLSVVFSMLFLFIGRRGYGESTTLQTLAIARAEDGRNWSVFQWNAFFVTSGDDYQATGKNQQALFSTANTMDKEDVRISSLDGGSIAMRIPPFTSQTFVSRRRVGTEDWKLNIVDFQAQASSLVRLGIQTGDQFPASDKSKYWVLLGRNIYEMKLNSETGQLQLLGGRKYLASFCTPKFDYSYINPWTKPAGDVKDSRSESEKFMDEAIANLVRRSLLDDLMNRPNEFELPSDRVRLFVYTEVPDEFLLNVSAEVRATGRILFTKDLFLRDQTTDQSSATPQQ